MVDVVSTLSNGTADGTGIALTSTGEVLTNNHVIEGATSITVTDVGNGRTYTAVVAGYDTTDDIAVLQLQHASGLKTATVGDSSAVKVGGTVVGIGNAGGRGGRPAAAVGKVTALGQTITVSDQASGTTEQLTGMIRTNANIQAGDSGGPLVSSQGQVIGIDTTGSSSYQLGSQQAQTQAYAIPINKAVSIADQIEAGRSSATVHIGATAFPGVEVQSAGSSAQADLPGSTSTGVTIAGVVSGHPPPGPACKPATRSPPSAATRSPRPRTSKRPGGLPPRRQDQHRLAGPGRPHPHRHRDPGRRPGRLTTCPGRGGLEMRTTQAPGSDPHPTRPGRNNGHLETCADLFTARYFQHAAHVHGTGYDGGGCGFRGSRRRRTATKAGARRRNSAGPGDA